MSDHLTLRVRAGTADRLGRRVRATGIPARTLAARYVDEGIRRDDHPRITFVDGPSGRRAAVLGTGLDVWEVIATVRDNGGNLRRVAEYLSVDLSIVEAAATYYGEFKEEIDSEIAANEEESARGLEQWRAAQAAIAR